MLEPIDFSAFTDADSRALEHLRLARLKELIEPVSRTITRLGVDNVFHLHCQNSALIDELLDWEVGEAAQIILGCESVNIWFANEIVWASTKTELCFISNLDVEFTRDDGMATATLQRETIGAEVKNQVAEAIAPTIDQLVEQELALFASNGEMASLIRDRVQQRVNDWAKSLQTRSTQVAKPVETSQPATTSDANFKIANSYGDTLHNALTALVPEAADRSAMLKAIEKKQKKGIAFIENQVLPHYPEQQQARAKDGLIKQSTIDRARQRLVKAK